MDALRGLVLSEARAKVLAALFGERGRTFYQAELARATGLPIVAVQRQLKRLSAAGLVSTSLAAGRKVYSADSRSPVFDEVSSIVRKLRGPAVSLRSALKAERVEVAFVFGSFAAGSAGATSDIDVMVLGSESSHAVRRGMSKAERALGRSVNEHVMTTTEWRARLRKEDPFLTNVRGGPKLWVIGDEEALAGLDPRPKPK
jgi:predicted nucleotidyltransferase